MEACASQVKNSRVSDHYEEPRTTEDQKLSGDYSGKLKQSVDSEEKFEVRSSTDKCQSRSTHYRRRHPRPKTDRPTKMRSKGNPKSRQRHPAFFSVAKLIDTRKSSHYPLHSKDGSTDRLIRIHAGLNSESPATGTTICQSPVKQPPASRPRRQPRSYSRNDVKQMAQPLARSAIGTSKCRFLSPKVQIVR
jgi:hypothetical protein